MALVLLEEVQTLELVQEDLEVLEENLIFLDRQFITVLVVEVVLTLVQVHQEELEVEEMEIHNHTHQLLINLIVQEMLVQMAQALEAAEVQLLLHPYLVLNTEAELVL